MGIIFLVISADNTGCSTTGFESAVSQLYLQSLKKSSICFLLLLEGLQDYVILIIICHIHNKFLLVNDTRRPRAAKGGSKSSIYIMKL
jgi:hypothetical protein